MVIRTMQSVKYLGVWIDQGLWFCEYITHTPKKSERTVKALSKIMPNILEPKKGIVRGGKYHSIRSAGMNKTINKVDQLPEEKY